MLSYYLTGGLLTKQMADGKKGEKCVVAGRLPEKYM
jgi:hypothetical protein